MIRKAEGPRTGGGGPWGGVSFTRSWSRRGVSSFGMAEVLMDPKMPQEIAGD